MLNAVRSLAVLAVVAQVSAKVAHDPFALGTSAMTDMSPVFEASSVVRRQVELPDMGDSGDAPGEMDPNPQTSFNDGDGDGDVPAAAAGDFQIGEGIEKGNPVTEPACLKAINDFRRSIGAPAMTYVRSKQSCVAAQVCVIVRANCPKCHKNACLRPLTKPKWGCRCTFT